MKKIKALGQYQKAVLLFILAMLLVFAVIYPITIRQTGFVYKDEILMPHRANGNTVYSGDYQGLPVCFTVFSDRTVRFQYGDKIYGPYAAKEDPSAIPKGMEQREHIVGVELRCGEELFFRGAVLHSGESRILFHENGSIVFSVTTDTGITMNENGNVIDPMEPSISTILELMDAPELSHKGNWVAGLGGFLICIITILSILFADDLFRWSLRFKIRNHQDAEPTDWVITSRYITWTLLPIAALLLFISGLQ